MTRNLPAWLLANPTLLKASGIVATPIVRAEPVLPSEEPRREPTSSKKILSYSKRRRARLKRAKRCINGWAHGTATHGVRCKTCADKRTKKPGAEQ